VDLLVTETIDQILQIVFHPRPQDHNTKAVQIYRLVEVQVEMVVMAGLVVLEGIA
jgi:hypothetical protein